jgi:hypothetical protein
MSKKIIHKAFNGGFYVERDGEIFITIKFLFEKLDRLVRVKYLDGILQENRLGIGDLGMLAERGIQKDKLGPGDYRIVS